MNGYTHSGVFHADDIFSTIFLSLIISDFRFHRVNKITDEIKNQEDSIIYDIGGGKFDHHQKDAEIREDGYKYSSLGLLLKYSSIDRESEFYKAFKSVADVIDITDNYGPKVHNEPFMDVIRSMNPLFNENKSSDEMFIYTYNACKILCVNYLYGEETDESLLGFLNKNLHYLLNREEAVKKAKEEAPFLFMEMFKNHFKNGVLYTPISIPKFYLQEEDIGEAWQEVKFVISEDKERNTFSCVPFGSNSDFKFDVSDAKIQEGCVFAHPGGFLTSFNNKENAIKFAESLC